MIHRRDVLKSALVAAISSVSAVACNACKPRGASAIVRCAHCGMRVEPSSHWAAGALDAHNQPLAFDTPGCLVRFRETPRGQGLQGEWVIEYYGTVETHTPARDVQYVVGSDVIGPMGPDAIPVRADRAEQFRVEHKGTRVVPFEQAASALASR